MWKEDVLRACGPSTATPAGAVMYLPWSWLPNVTKVLKSLLRLACLVPAAMPACLPAFTAAAANLPAARPHHYRTSRMAWLASSSWLCELACLPSIADYHRPAHIPACAEPAARRGSLQAHDRHCHPHGQECVAGLLPARWRKGGGGGAHRQGTHVAWRVGVAGGRATLEGPACCLLAAAPGRRAPLCLLCRTLYQLPAGGGGV